MNESKEELKRRQAVLEVMKLTIKDSPYNSQKTNQQRKRTKIQKEIEQLQKKSIENSTN